MPKGVKRYFRNRKRRSGAFKKRRRNARRLRLMKTPVPRTFCTKLKYHDQVSLQPIVGGAINIYKYRANDCYDPNFTGIGHQPRGFDQLMAMYDHFVVIASKIYVSYSTSPNATTAYTIGIALRDSATSDDLNGYMESSYNRAKVVHAGGGGNETKWIGMKCNPNKFLGRSKPMADPELKGSVSASPAEGAYYHIYVDPYGSNTEPIEMNVTLEYTVVLLEPKNPGQS